MTAFLKIKPWKLPKINFRKTGKNILKTWFPIFKNRFKLKHKNSNIEYFLRHSEGLIKMKDIANDTSFEPTIICQNSEKGVELIIEYHLQFPNWTQVLSPIIAFYKEFIDRFN